MDSQSTDAGAEARELGALLNGYQNTALLYVAAKLGLADLLADAPKGSVELARSLGAHPLSLHRILRGLVVLGVCSEGGDGRFGLTSMGNLLRTGVEGSLKNLAVVCGEQYAGAWGGLLHSAMTGETAFNHVFGMSQWEHRRHHADLNERFSADLNEETARAAAAIVEAYDFPAEGVVCDVGGGHGALLCEILRACPSASGILFEQPHVAAAARSHLESRGVAGRCRVAEGDFFEGVPEGADLYVLKSVIHDWPDERGVAILRNCHGAMKGQGGVILVERLMPERAKDVPDTIFVDLHMLAVTGGRERGEAEYRALLAEAGFTLTRAIRTRGPFSIIEGEP
ncbi:MAG: methyltransferase [Planctomycetota bacterium]|jgi:hypothetical protein